MSYQKVTVSVNEFLKISVGDRETCAVFLLVYSQLLGKPELSNGLGEGEAVSYSFTAMLPSNPQKFIIIITLISNPNIEV